jgi:hypothetical protein
MTDNHGRARREKRRCAQVIAGLIVPEVVVLPVGARGRGVAGGCSSAACDRILRASGGDGATPNGCPGRHPPSTKVDPPDGHHWGTVIGSTKTPLICRDNSRAPDIGDANRGRSMPHFIYHVPGKKVGCTKRHKGRLKQQGLTIDDIEILEVLHDVSDQEAGDREHAWAEKFGYPKGVHYIQNFSNRLTHEQCVENGRKAVCALNATLN